MHKTSQSSQNYIAQNQTIKNSPLNMSSFTKQTEIIADQIVRAMIDSVSLNTLLNSLTISLKEQLKLNDCLIFLWDSSTHQPSTVFTSNPNLKQQELLDYTSCLGKTYEDILSSGKIASVSNLAEIPCGRLSVKFLDEHQDSMVIIPIYQVNCYWGAIALIYPHQGNQWQKSKLNCLRNIANHCVLAIQKNALQVAQEKAETLNQKIVGGLDYTFHECRQPLTAIILAGRMLYEQIYGSLNQKQIEYVQGIVSSGEHLLSLTNDFLDLSKIEAEKEELFLEKILVEEVCQASLAIIQQAATQKQLGVELEIDPDVSFCVADSMRLKQILVNLLSNGIKYTEQGSITLKVRQDETGFFFCVIDTGIGISPENQKKLFQPFVQIANQHNRKQKGSGLGLVLSLKLARMHGGDLTVESEENKGTCFTVYIPKILNN